MDPLTKEQRHLNMAAIRSRDTKLELVVRKFPTPKTNAEFWLAKIQRNQE